MRTATNQAPMVVHVPARRGAGGAQIAGKETATAAYARLSAEVAGLMRKFEARLVEHAKKQQAEPRHWGYVGDLGYFADQLRSIASDPE